MASVATRISVLTKLFLDLLLYCCRLSEGQGIEGWDQKSHANMHMFDHVCMHHMCLHNCLSIREGKQMCLCKLPVVFSAREANFHFKTNLIFHVPMIKIQVLQEQAGDPTD